MKLVSPEARYREEFASFYNDILANDPENAEYYQQGVTDFSEYVQRLKDEQQGINLPDGYVPCSHFWLLSGEVGIIGAIRVRHNIDNDFLSFEGGHIGYDIAPSFRRMGNGKQMLKLALTKALELGIESALVTADEDNVASRKVIEHNGGKFDTIIQGKVFPNPIARYWVPCA